MKENQNSNDDMLKEPLLPSSPQEAVTDTVTDKNSTHGKEEDQPLLTNKCEVVLPNQEDDASELNTLPVAIVAEDPAPVISSDVVPLDSTTSQTIMMRVVAPTTLDEGYAFDATVNGVTFSVTVPKGGVREGESFEAPYLAPSSSASLLDDNTNPHRIPSSKWRDGLFDCCKQGCCHPSLTWACCFKEMGVAQVMTRLNLNLCGNPVRNGKTRVFYYIIAISIVFEILVMTFASLISRNTEALIHNRENDDDIIYDQLLQERSILLYVTRIIGTSFVLFTLFLIARTRYRLRQKYNIPPTCFACCSSLSKVVGMGCDDVCCAYFCGPCTVSQMSRHTADYDTYRAHCCSKDGLGSQVGDTTAATIAAV